MSDTVITTEIDAPILETTLDIIQSFAQEAKLHFSPEGMETSVVDPANVGMHFIDLSPEAFVSTPEEGQITLGINVETLSDLISKADADDLITLGFNPETRKLHVEYGTVEAEIALIDPDAIRQEPDTPDLGWCNQVVVPPKELKSGIEMADLMSDMVTFEVRDDCTMAAEGDTDSVRYGLDPINWEFQADTDSTFSLEYLNDVKGVLQGEEVTVNLGDEQEESGDYPVKIEYQYAEGNAEVETLVAPRIVSD